MVSRIVQAIRARVCRSQFAIAFRFKRLRHQFAVRLLQQNLDLALGLFQLLLAFARQFNALFKEFHRFIKRKLRAFQFANDFFETRERALEVWLFLRFWSFRSWSIHAAFFKRRSLLVALAKQK
jgi:hypothetical protein